MKKVPGLGLDWWDVAIQAFVTICLGVMVSEAAGPHDEDMALASVFAISAMVLAVRRHFALRKLAREPESFSTGEVAAERIADLEARVADLELTHTRLAELEERMDFSERLLAQAPGQLRAADPRPN